MSKPLKSFKGEIIDFLRGNGIYDCNIKTLQILIPRSSYELEKIIRFLITDDDSGYNEVVNQFIFNNDGLGEIVRSLYYLMYDQPFKFRIYCENYNPICQNEFIEKNDAVEVPQNIKNRLKKKKNLNSFWRNWVSSFKKKNYGSSTLWTYIKVPHPSIHEGIVVSAYYIFSGDSSKLTKKVISVINKKTQDYLLELVLSLYKDSILKHSVLSAISQVMSRNLSHNFGSHVLAKLASKEFLKNFKLPDGKDILDLIEIFNAYVQNRMEYISDISFGAPAMSNDKYFYKEIAQPFEDNLLLTKTISGLNDFNYEIHWKYNDIKLHKDSQEDPLLDMSNDVLGCHAFYNILENYIRNTAKHNNNKGSAEKPIIFTVKVKPIKSLYQIELYDNIDLSMPCSDERTKKLQEEKDEKKNIFVINGLEKEKPISKADDVVYTINEVLNGTILTTPEYKLRDKNLGLLEMEASASYLRRIEVNEIEDDKYKIENLQHYRKDGHHRNKAENVNILRAFIKEDGEGKHLGFTFYIPIPKKILFVDFTKEEKKNEDFKKNGIDFTDEENLKECLEDGKTFNHKFLIYKNHHLKETIEDYKNALPYRTLEINDEKELFAQDDKDINEKIDKLEEKIWEKWINKKGINLEEVNLNPKGTSEEKLKFLFTDHINNVQAWGKHKESRLQNKLSFLEPLSSKGKGTYPFINSVLNNQIVSVKTKSQYTESCLSNILILDERIQNYMENENYDNKEQYSFLYPASNIFVPFSLADKKPKENQDFYFDKIIDLGQKDFDKDFYDSFLDIIKNINLRNSEDSQNTRYDIVVIHFSILERLREFDKDEGLKNEILNLSNRVSKIVLTSGRGKNDIDTSKYNASFVNLSPLINAVHSIRSKFLLYNLLINSKPSYHEKKDPNHY